MGEEGQKGSRGRPGPVGPPGNPGQAGEPGPDVRYQMQTRIVLSVLCSRLACNTLMLMATLMMKMMTMMIVLMIMDFKKEIVVSNLLNQLKDHSNHPVTFSKVFSSYDL